MQVTRNRTTAELYSPDLVDVTSLRPGRRYKVTTVTEEFAGVLVGYAKDIKGTTIASFVPYDGSWHGKQKRVVLGEITRIEVLV